MISREEAQELHELVGLPIEENDRVGFADSERISVRVEDLERAREIAAIIVSDLEDGAPQDSGNETAATDGSREAYEESLRARVQDLEAELRMVKARLEGARVIVENMSGLQEVRRDGHLQKEIRELRMILNGGDAIRKTARADELVEEWLQDPRRSIFGLAADLLDVMGPADK